MAAVVFDLDGVLIDSEGIWAAVREAYVEETGGRWRDDSQATMMGMSTGEWAAYLAGDLGVPGQPEAIAAEVVERIAAALAADVPLLPGAAAAVARLAARWPLAVASSSPKRVIAQVLDASGLARHFTVAVSSEEVPAGKPAPDVYLEAARRLEVPPARCVAVEDSSNGLLAAAAAGMAVIAVPNRQFPPRDDALRAAGLVLDRLGEVTPAAVVRALRRR